MASGGRSAPPPSGAADPGRRSASGTDERGEIVWNPQLLDLSLDKPRAEVILLVCPVACLGSDGQPLLADVNSNRMKFSILPPRDRGVRENVVLPAIVH